MDCLTVLIYLVGVLSVIVMLLIGWQIFNYFSFECRMKKAFAKKLSAVERKFDSRIKALNIYFSGINSMMQARSFLNEKKYPLAIEGTVWAIQKYVESGDIQKQNIDICIDIIRAALMKGKGDMYLTPTQKIEYVHTLSPLIDDSEYEVIEMIIQVPEK